MGGIVALGTAMIAQVPGSETILPLNPVMAFTGAPVVIWVIIRQRSLHKSFGS
jgi:iron complex transport system permease protein